MRTAFVKITLTPYGIQRKDVWRNQPVARREARIHAMCVGHTKRLNRKDERNAKVFYEDLFAWLERPRAPKALDLGGLCRGFAPERIYRFNPIRRKSGREPVECGCC
jgi:hypothetical protein